jgi:Mn-dependent DtxR family transcriptional regulator
MLTRDQVLRAVHHCQHHTATGVARTSDLAARLGITGPSVTVRIQELASTGLVTYTPRRGAVLTEQGRLQTATALQNLHQIERFLAEVLGLPRNLCANEAELLYHHITENVMSAISGFVTKLKQ